MVVQLARNAVEDELSAEEWSEADEAFDNLTSEIGQDFEPRRILDKSILNLAGMPEHEQDEFLDRYYSNMLVEIVNLKLMMD